MLSYNLDSMEAAKKLILMCEKYKDHMEIDVIHGKQVIDGYSILGVCSLIGHIVSLEIRTQDLKLTEQFKEELQKIQ